MSNNQLIFTVALFAYLFLMVRMGLQFRSKTLDKKDRSRFDELAARVEKIEKRMANLETIMLDTEKQREFDRVISGGVEGV